MDVEETELGWLRRCPQCGTPVYHTQKYNAQRAVKERRLCKVCGAKKAGRPGAANPFYGKRHTSETRDRLSEIAIKREASKTPDDKELFKKKMQAEALREAAGMIPEFPEPDNPYSYDPWDDDSVDPTNLEDVTGAAVDRGWSMGAFRAREEARRTILTRAAELENGEE